MKKLRINEESAGKRLDVYLADALDLTRSQAQKLIKEGPVLVNDEPAKVALKLSEDDVIKVPKIKKDKVKKGKVPKLDILHEDKNVIVINKPAGILVHRTTDIDQSVTLVDALKKHYSKIKTVGDDPDERPGIVHRLDKKASGVMIVAKNQEAFNHLKVQFKDRYAKKEYLTLVYGTPSDNAGTIDFRIGRSARTGKMVAKPAESEEGREALTDYVVEERFSTTTLLRVRIHTGRQHQIRAHMLAMDLPVVGDGLYKKKQMKNINPIELDRLFLHAAKLTITLPGGETKTFEAPLPEELENLLNDLRK